MTEELTAERRAELEDVLAKMQKASLSFYGDAVLIGCHPFIEFTGFMNEYIAICRAALEQGIDFTEVSAHHGGELPMKIHHARYLGEKFGCIFSSTFGTDPKLLEVFLNSADLVVEPTK